ncbi:MAG: ABC transporter permease [Thermodesulfobacteriota bacterium]
MRFLPLAIHNLLRHRIRSLLTVVGIAASVAVLFSIVSFNRGFEEGLNREVARTGLHFMVVPSGCPHEVAALVLHGAVIPSYLDQQVLGRVRDSKDIEIASPMLVVQTPNPERDRVDLLHGMEMADLSRLKPQWRIKGRVPAAPGEALLGAEVAGHDQTAIGSTLRYPAADRPITVVGILEKTGGQDDAFVYLPLQTVQQMVRKPSSISAIGVRVKNPERVEAAARAVSENIPGIQIVTMNQVVASLGTLASAAKVLSLSIAAIAVLISAVGVMNSILMAIFERTSEIGMIRAMGASRSDVFRIVLKETVLLTLIGGLAGVALAVAGAGLIEAFVRKFMVYVPAGRMIAFDPRLAVSCIAFSVGMGVFSGIYPAWRAAKINPIEAIKG